MTNGAGKSDRPTVPEKSPNNAGRPAAEGMKGRRWSAKGNLQQQNASRTPSREDAHSALERVRQAADKDQEPQLAALLHPHLQPRNTAHHLLHLKPRQCGWVPWRRYGGATRPISRTSPMG